MSDAILVVNAGSSSIKFSVFLEHGEALNRLAARWGDGSTIPKIRL